MFEVLGYEFMRNALVAGIAISIACGVIGSLVVINRMVFISGGIAHAAYGGIGIAIFFGLSPLLSAGIFSIAAALAMGVLTLKYHHRSDTVIGVLWAVGMAVGIILIDFTPGYSGNVMSFLFGSILTVPSSDLWLMGGLDMVIILVVAGWYPVFLAMSCDREFTSLRGVNTTLFYFVLLTLTAVTVVMTIQLVGLILVIALLTIPTHIAERHAASLARMMVLSCIIGTAFTVCGLWLSFMFNLTSGATIILTAAAGYALNEAVVAVATSHSHGH